MSPEPNCPACRVAMDLGYQLDLGHASSRRQAEWVEGSPERNFWTGLKTKDRAVLPILTYRCPRCGLLASFANETSGTSSS
ncbi:MAG: hypothetical protein ACKVXR_18265 [Planctomycetota bacterium]